MNPDTVTAEIRQDFLDQMKHAQLYSDNLQATSEFHSFFSAQQTETSKSPENENQKRNEYDTSLQRYP